MRSLAKELELINLGEPVYFGGLTLFPLFRKGLATPEAGYSLLEEAVRQGVARVTEVGEGGTVPELRFENSSDQPVLLFDGEELIGAKQNRVVNLTILAPAKQVVVIPVSCVEAGRWHFQSAAFRTSEHVMYSRARAAKAAQVSRSMTEHGSRRSAQGDIWLEIAAKSETLGAPSPTGAMQAIYDSKAVQIDAYVRAFTWADCQAGVIFGTGSQTIGLDLLDHPQTMRSLLPKLVRSYALDAMEAPNAAKLGRSGATEFLEQVATAQSLIRPAIGMGEDWRITGDRISGAALWAERRCVHLCAFTTDDKPEHQEFHTRMTRPARRRSR